MNSSLLEAIRRKPMYWTDFLGQVQAANMESTTPFDFTVIANGSQASVNAEPNHPGIVALRSGTTNPSGFRVQGEAAAWRLAGGEVFSLIFQPKVSGNANTTIRFGFLDTTSDADAVDGAYFEIPAGSFAIVGKTASNSTRTTSSTIATLTVDTWYRGRVTVNADATSVLFEIFNDSGTLLGSQSNTTNIPTAAGRETGGGVLATNTSGSATPLVWLDWLAIAYEGRALTR